LTTKVFDEEVEATVPLITPVVVFSVKLVGSVPELIDQVYGPVPPEADNVVE
jgi:hypothetical protein